MSRCLQNTTDLISSHDFHSVFFFLHHNFHSTVKKLHTKNTADFACLGHWIKWGRSVSQFRLFLLKGGCCQKRTKKIFTTSNSRQKRKRIFGRDFQLYKRMMRLFFSFFKVDFVQEWALSPGSKRASWAQLRLVPLVRNHSLG